MSKNEARRILIGNSFPLSLIRTRVVIEPRSLEELKKELEGAMIYSFWGHGNTLEVARETTGFDFTPHTGRPALTFSADKRPTLSGHTFSECWILSPDYAVGFRPAVGEEVGADKIQNWQVLRITFQQGEEQ